MSPTPLSKNQVRIHLRTLFRPPRAPWVCVYIRGSTGKGEEWVAGEEILGKKSGVKVSMEIRPVSHLDSYPKMSLSTHVYLFRACQRTTPGKTNKKPYLFILNSLYKISLRILLSVLCTKPPSTKPEVNTFQVTHRRT